MDNREKGNQALETGELGEAKVRPIFLAWGWIPRKDNPDRGVDFNVDVPAGDGRPQERFLVQVKTSNDRKVSPDGSWSIRVDGNALARYGQSRHPVFLVGVNLKNNECRWLDLTLVLETEPNDISHGKSFKLSPNHRFGESDRGGLDEAVIAAFRRHNARFGSPAESLKYREQQMQSKDLRFAIHAALIDGQERYTIKAREPVPLNFQLQLNRKEDKAALVDFMKYGIPAHINPAGFSVTGSPLFESLSIDIKSVTFGSVNASRRLQLGFIQGKTEAFECVLDEDTEVTRAQRGFAVRLVNPDIPFHLELRVDHVNKQAHCSFQISNKAWVGHDMRELPFFESVHRLLGGAIEHRNLALAAKHHGKVSPPTLIPLDDGDALEALRIAWRSFNTVACLVKVCEWAGSNVVWRNGGASDSEAESWVRAANILDGNFADIDVERATYTLGPGADLSKWPDDEVDIAFELHTSQVVTAWNEIVAEIPLIVRFMGFEVERNSDGVPCALKAKPGCSAGIVVDPKAKRPTE